MENEFLLSNVVCFFVKKYIVIHVLNKRNITSIVCEYNFYSGGGSKLNETARSYKTITEEAKNISGFQFVWFTDGVDWNSARHNLEETFDVLNNLYNLKDLENGTIDTLVDSKKYLESLMNTKKLLLIRIETK